MRPVMHGDVVSAARAVLAVPVGARKPAIRRIFARAEAADQYRQRHGVAHPLWGNGSVMAVARMSPLAPEPDLDNAAYCACLADVFETLIDWHRGVRG